MEPNNMFWLLYGWWISWSSNTKKHNLINQNTKKKTTGDLTKKNETS
jgi:hypothetical protein